MSEIQKPFEITVNETTYQLMAGKCAVALFYEKQEVDYLAVDISQAGDEESSTLRIFNNPMLVRWMAGLSISPEGFQNITLEVDGEDKRFRELYGWNPAVVIKNQPSEWEEEMWLDVNTRDLSNEWEGFLSSGDGDTDNLGE